MATVRVTHHLNNAAIARLLVSDKVANSMFVRGLLVESAAKVELSSGPPRRVDTGRLRASIFTRRIRRLGLRGARVGTNVAYGLMVHNGTGIFGPRHAPIRPRRARVLVFIPRGQTHPVFAHSVRGMEANPYLRNALPAARIA